MAPETGSAIIVLAAFVLPGFVTLLFRERVYWISVEQSPFERLLGALYYSALIYGILTVGALAFRWSTDDVSDLYRGARGLWTYAVLGVVALLLLPLLIALCGGWWYRSRRFRPWVLSVLGISISHRTPAGWERFFLSGESAMLLVTLGDGRVVGGYFGDQSLAGYTAHTPDLYLEQRWTLDADGWFLAPAAGSQGVWIKAEQIHSFEAYTPARQDAPKPGERQDAEVESADG